MNSFFFDSDPFGSSGGPVDNEEYYDLLGVSKDCTPKELRKAYLKMSLKHHPDKGGDVEEFKKITEAHEVLSDPVKRKNYDKYGKKGAAGGPGFGGGSPDDLFSMFTRGGRRRQQQEETSGSGSLRKAKSVTHPVRVTLEELYVGKRVEMSITRKIIASVMSPREPIPLSKLNDAFTICAACRGRGMTMERRQLAPGMIQQMSMPCRQCSRTGMALKDGFLETTARQTVVIEIERGTSHNTKIVKESLGDMNAGTIPGDLVFVIAQEQHPLFKRKGHDLLMKKEISLTQALCGLKFDLKKLDGSTVCIDNTTNGGPTCIKPNSIMVVEDLGMPKPGTLESGRLFLNFTVVFPAAPLSKTIREKLASALPKNPELDFGQSVKSSASTGGDDNYEEAYTLDPVDPNSFGFMEADERGAYDSDEEDARGGAPPQCRQM